MDGHITSIRLLFYTCWEASLLTMMNPTQTRVTLASWHVVGDENKYQSVDALSISSGIKGYSQDEGRHRTAVFLTHGTTEEGLDFVSVLQPVPHTGKHFQSGYLTPSTATWEVDKGDGCEQREGCERGGRREGKEKTRGRKEEGQG